MAGTFPGKRVDGLTIKSKNNQSKMRTLFILKCTNGLMGKWLNIPTFQSSHSTWTFWTTANRFHFMWSNKVVTFARCLHLALNKIRQLQCQITSTVYCNLFELKMPCRSSKPIIFLSFFGYFFPPNVVFMVGASFNLRRRASSSYADVYIRQQIYNKYTLWR